MPRGLGGNVIGVAGTLLIFGLAAAAVAIGWRWGSGKNFGVG
jgi:hypothetical protein